MNIFQANCNQLKQELKYKLYSAETFEERQRIKDIIETLEAAAVVNDFRTYCEIKAMLHPSKEGFLKRLAKRIVVEHPGVEIKMGLIQGNKKYTVVKQGVELVKPKKHEKVIELEAVKRLRELGNMRYREYIMNSIEYIEDLQHLKDYAQTIGEQEAFTDKQTYTKYLVNEMTKREGLGKLYDVPRNEMFERMARAEVSNGLEYEPKKQRELQI